MSSPSESLPAAGSRTPSRETVATLLALQGYRLGAAEQAAVHVQFSRIAEIAAPLLTIELPAELEAGIAPVLQVPNPLPGDAP